VFEVEAEWAGEVIGELGDADFVEDGVPGFRGRDAEFPGSLPCWARAVPFLLGGFVEEQGDAGGEFGGWAAEEESAGPEGVVACAAAAADERETAGAAAAGQHGGEEEGIAGEAGVVGAEAEGEARSIGEPCIPERAVRYHAFVGAGDEELGVIVPREFKPAGDGFRVFGLRRVESGGFEEVEEEIDAVCG
jgi:hypothetical protein